MLQTVAGLESICHITVIESMTFHSLMDVLNDCHELWWATIIGSMTCHSLMDVLMHCYELWWETDDTQGVSKVLPC